MEKESEERQVKRKRDTKQEGDGETRTEAETDKGYIVSERARERAKNTLHQTIRGTQVLLRRDARVARTREGARERERD